jgi:aspartate carbamoyltransferase catalytic subunit
MIETFKGKDIISISDFDKNDILPLLEYIGKMKKEKHPELLRGKILGSCFFEPSTRTRLSFETSMHRLGGSVVGFSDFQTTSAMKGESLYDTMKMMEMYVDVIAIRHPLEGAAQLAADAVQIPIINAGDGANQHPTQTIQDLFSIQETQGTLQGLHIALVGDLKHGRTVHSLAEALKPFKPRFYFISPPSLEMPKDICEQLRENGVKFSYHRSLEEIIPKLDILYVTRIQEERFTNRMDYEEVKNFMQLKAEHLHSAKKNLKVLHPLPRVSEISNAVDNTPYAYYFQQAQNGLYTRQALLSLVCPH